MAVERGKNRYSVSLSPESASSLKERASSEGVSLSALLAQIVDEHFIVKETLANYERDMETVRTNTEGALQLRAECENRAEEAKQLEGDVERLEGITKKLDSELKASEASRKTVEDGFQHRIELLEKDKAKLEAELQTEKILSNERKADKENLQKQLELVTLRLPAPKVGFWARLFGKKEA